MAQSWPWVSQIAVKKKKKKKKNFFFIFERCRGNIFYIFDLKDHCHYTGKCRGFAHNICNLRYKTPKEIPIVFHNGSTYDYHFIIKELAEEFERQFECLGENTEKYITFSVPIIKQLDNVKTVTYKLKFVDSFRFMSSSLSILGNSLSEGLHNGKCILTTCQSKMINGTAFN